MYVPGATDIQILPPLLINQIAAGEVIERPASVVKELVENSVDAGATQIEVTIERGGHELIQISDDGCGIPQDQLLLAMAPHATSKINKQDDLDAIGSLGFRGEALASIVSVSRTTITSRPADQETACQIHAEGDDFGRPEPCGRSPGTTITVRNLFFNTPARRKFLRTVQTEFNHISELVQRMALSHPGIGFKLTHNGKVTGTLDLPPNQTPRQRVLSVLGREVEPELHEVSSEPAGDDAASMAHHARSGVTLWGMAGSPGLARGTNRYQYVFLNGRMIRDKTIMHAIKEAYRGILDPTRFPMVVLYIEMDPRMVDVNVHPAKSEVRFRDTQVVHGLVLSSLRRTLLAADITRPVSVPSSNWSLRKQQDRTEPRLDFTRVDRTSSSSDHRPVPDPGDRTQIPGGSGFSVQQARETVEPAPPLPPPSAADVDHAGADGRNREETGAHDESPSPTGRPPRVLQVHNSYLVVEDEEGIVIIDQHALHERIMFEDLKRRILSGNLESQRLLMPAVIDVQPTDLDVLGRAEPLLTRLGIEAEPMGRRQIGIHAFPSFLFERNVDPIEFTTSLLAMVGQEHTDGPISDDWYTDEAVVHDVLDMMACKAAVKAGDHMTTEEIEALLSRRGQIDRSGSCPHGRPTTIRLSLTDLEKQFERR
ncbi:MAG: DNA mismatch repair endonuclease MutL [Planctomycetes bacterium]|nr:DNA mismatch repair endonuclease MutL [Planctomycetota bacterium]NOG55954.1 DNA mismatch repair endonuclease MutL [Planctomycetota bacterium]